MYQYVDSLATSQSSSTYTSSDTILFPEKIFLYRRKSQSDWLHYFSKIQDGYTCTYKIRCNLKQFIMKKKDCTKHIKIDRYNSKDMYQ